MPIEFCPREVVWGDVASWVSAVAALAGVIGIWFAYVELRDRRIDREEMLRARLSALGIEVEHALSVLTGITEAFKGITTWAGLEPWLVHTAHVVRNLETQRLKSASEIQGVPSEIATWAALALNAIQRAQQNIERAQANPDHFRIETAIQEAAINSVGPVKECATKIWEKTHPHQTPHWE